MGNTESREELEPVFAAIATDYDAGFALDLYKQVVAGKNYAVDGRNQLLSPLSVATALAMAGAGARGKTLQEIHACLKCPNGEAMHEFFYQIRIAIMKSGTDNDEEDPTLSFANGLWLEKSLHLSRALETLVKKSYGTEPALADFRGKAEEERTIVNKWLWKATNGRIQDLLPQGSLEADTRMVLANYLYFKGFWNERFYPEETLFEDFHLLDGHTVSVPFMTSGRNRLYIESFESYKVLKLPYFRVQDQRSFSMFFVLPDAKDGLVQLEKNLDAKALTTQFKSIQKRDPGKFLLPKFRISSGFRLKEVLRGLGLNAPFSKDADFSDVVEGAKADELHLSDVFHKCFMEINEEGTDAAPAAASLAVAEEPKSLAKHPSPIDFVADHPFLFCLVEENTGIFLFIGRITNPSVSD